jgi:hypothetical protein
MAVFVVTNAPMLSCVPGTPDTSDLLRPSVLPVKVIAPVALKVALTISGMSFHLLSLRPP